MGDHKVAGIICILYAFLALANAFQTFAPADKEAVYSYKGLIRAGTQLPVYYASQFILEGNLHVQSDTNSSVLRFTDLKYKIYNGKLDHMSEYKAKEIPLPSEAEDLLKSFEVIYGETGKAVGLVYGKNEKVFTINVKKSIASIFQIDFEHASLNSQKPHAFVTEEQSIYGKSNTLYNVMHRQNLITVQKMHQMDSTTHLYHAWLRNVEYGYCEAKYEDPLSHDSQRRYSIEKQDDQYVVKDIEANGGFYFYPLRARSEAFFLYVNQTFHLKELKPVEQRMFVENGQLDHDLSQSIWTYNEHGVHDITGGRRASSEEKLVASAMQELNNIVEYMNEAHHINMHTPNIRKGQAVKRLLKILMKFHKEVFEALRTRIKQKDNGIIMEVFYQMLPHVGTPCSVAYIKDLITNKSVKEDIIVDMLESLGVNVKLPTRKMIQNAEGMIRLDESFSWKIRKSAILSFSVLAHKAYKREEERYHLGLKDTVIHDEREIEAAYDKYVEEFVNRLQSSNNYGEQIVYLLALHNMKMKSTVKHILPIIYGKNNLRYVAMKSIYPLVANSPEETFKIYWPILTDYDEPTYVRLSALFYIMETRPSISMLLNIYWQMQNEPDVHVKSFYHSYVKSVMQSTDFCKEHYKLTLAQISKYMQNYDVNTISGYYQIDYRDEDFKFGGDMLVIDFITNDSIGFYYKDTSVLFNKPVENYAVHLFVFGFEHGLVDKFQLNTTSSSRMFNYNDLWEIVSDNDKAQIQVSVAKNGFIVGNYYYDKSNMKEVYEMFGIFFNDQYKKAENRIGIDFLFSQMYMATDLGVPFEFDWLYPSVDTYKINVNKEVSDKIININIDSKWKTSKHSDYGLSFYNPFVDVWQGVKRFSSLDAVLPVNMDISINTQQQKMKLTWKTHEHNEENILGVRSHVAAMVFVQDDTERGILLQSSPHCKAYEFVTRGEEYRNNYTIYHKDDSNTGYNYHFAVTDSEIHITDGMVKASREKMWTEVHKHFTNRLEYFILSLRNLYNHKFRLLPKAGMHGAMFKVEPSKEFPMTHLDLSVRFNQEYKRDLNIFMPETSYNTRATYVMKNNDNTVKSWDLSGSLNMNSGHTQNSWRVQLTRIIPTQKDFKVCVEGMEKYNKDSVMGRTSVAMSTSSDSKCNKDEVIVDITMTGEKSEEQMRSQPLYGACHYPRWYSVHSDEQILPCLASHTSLRKYIYNVKSSNIPAAFKETLSSWFDGCKTKYLSGYTSNENNSDVGENNIRVTMEYPLADKEINIDVITPHHVYKLSGISSEDWKLFGTYRHNTHYSKKFMLMHAIGLTEVCYVDRKHVEYNNQRNVVQEMPEEWVLYMGDRKEDPNYAVYARRVGNDIALKIIYTAHTIEITPSDEEYKVVIDGQIIQKEDYSLEWLYYQVHSNMNEGSHRPIYLIMPFIGTHVKYDAHHFKIEVPKMDVEGYGKCFTD